MASCNIVRGQIIRGVLGAALLGIGFYLAHINTALSFLFVLLALIPMRGCPACWGVGMFEAIEKSRREKAEKKKQEETGGPADTVAKTDRPS